MGITGVLDHSGVNLSTWGYGVRFHDMHHSMTVVNFAFPSPRWIYCSARTEKVDNLRDERFAPTKWAGVTRAKSESTSFHIDKSALITDGDRAPSVC